MNFTLGNNQKQVYKEQSKFLNLENREEDEKDYVIKSNNEINKKKSKEISRKIKIDSGSTDYRKIAKGYKNLNKVDKDDFSKK